MEITPQFLDQIRENKKIRRLLTREHPLWFSLLYLGDHLNHPLAPFHIEMFHLILQTECDFIVTMAFRESGKSTIMNMTNSLWSILGRPEKKFVVIMSKTQEQAKAHFSNIKAELENNELLKEDFGPFTESGNEWNKTSLELVYHGSKILCVDRDRSVRGLKYGQFRPDLIICDDLEDTSSKSSAAGYGPLYRRFQSEILPMGSVGTRIIILGNLISEDSFIMRLKNDINRGVVSGIFRAYPFLDDNDKVLWSQRFPDEKSLHALRNKMSGATWMQEYLLSLEGWLDDSLPTAPFIVKRSAQDEIVERFHERLRGLYKNYRKNLLSTKQQIPLIYQMAEYSITAPILKLEDEIRVGDYRYGKYKEFTEKNNQITKEFHEEIYQSYGRQA